MDIKETKKALRPLENKIRRMVSRCTLNSSEDKGLLTGQYEALEGETIDEAERLENYGLATRPPAGSEGAMLSVGGARDHPLIVAMEHREHRPENLKDGETALYSMFKQIIHLNENGDIIIKAPGKKVIIEAATVDIKTADKTTIESDLEVAKNVKDKNGTMQEMREAYNPHTHPDDGPPDEEM